MSVAMCEGCGRRASAGEQTCAACGRPLGSALREGAPPGWQTAAVEGQDVRVRPLHAADATGAAAAPAAEGEGTAEEIFLPSRARRQRRAPASGETPGASDVPQRLSELPGAAGWRVRVSAAQAALAARESSMADPATAKRRPRSHEEPDRLPAWVSPVLIAAILLCSLGATLLIVFHILRSGR